MTVSIRQRACAVLNRVKSPLRGTHGLVVVDALNARLSLPQYGWQNASFTTLTALGGCSACRQVPNVMLRVLINSRRAKVCSCYLVFFLTYASSVPRYCVFTRDPTQLSRSAQPTTWCAACWTCSWRRSGTALGTAAASRSPSSPGEAGLPSGWPPPPPLPPPPPPLWLWRLHQ